MDIVLKKMPGIIEFPGFGNEPEGFISVAEALNNVPFEIKRVFWTYFTPENIKRGGHAHYTLEQLIFAVSGTIEIDTESVDGVKNYFLLDKPSKGLYLPKMVWKSIRFSQGAVLLSLASDNYKKDDYIRDYKVFKKMNNDPSFS